MRWVHAMLRRLGLYKPYTHDEVINASTEDASREFEKSVLEVREATERRRIGNASLRTAIRNAKEVTGTTRAFEEFEEFVGASRSKRRKG